MCIVAAFGCIQHAEQYSQPCLEMQFEEEAGADLLGAQSVDDRGFSNVWVAHKADANVFLISAQA